MDGGIVNIIHLDDVSAQRDLIDLEERVRRGIAGCFEAGAALRQIRDDDRKLYKLKNGGQYQTFDAYCRGVWGLGKTHTYQLICANESKTLIEKSANANFHGLFTEGLMRPLSRLRRADEKLAAFAAAITLASDERRQPTGRHVSIAVQNLLENTREPGFSSTIKPTDNWNFSPVRYARRPGEDGHGYIPGDVYVNCLWYWTKPGQTVAAPMAGSGQIWHIYEERHDWARPEPWDLDLRMFDLNPRGEYEHLIEPNDLTVGLPVCNGNYDYIVMDVPYFGMVNGQYSDKASDLANMDISQWSLAIYAIARSCRQAQGDRGLATVISPNFRQIKTGEVILTTVVVRDAFAAAGYSLHDIAYASRRIQQDQSPSMGTKNNMAKRNRTMMTDISEVMTFQVRAA